MPESGERNDPYGAFNFLVEIDGVTVAGFSEASGLTSETDVVEYRTGAEDITVRKLPGLKKFTNIMLKRGFTASDELWQWRKAVMDGQTQRQSGTIVLLNEAREAAIKWTFREGWPSKWEGPAFNAKTSEVAIETLEIACEALELELA
ncbi:MAG: phage tail protein [Gemmatimonadetes bacterium]|nr:phage tail protein [Gemmatimonadota bacterium]